MDCGAFIPLRSCWSTRSPIAKSLDYTPDQEGKKLVISIFLFLGVLMSFIKRFNFVNCFLLNY